MALIRDIDHVAVAVESIEEALALFGDVLGASLVSDDDDQSGVRAVRVQLPGLRIELLQPRREDAGRGRSSTGAGRAWNRPVPGLTVEDVLDGRATWSDGRAHLRAEGGG